MAIVIAWSNFGGSASFVCANFGLRRRGGGQRHGADNAASTLIDPSRPAVALSIQERPGRRSAVRGDPWGGEMIPGERSAEPGSAPGK